MSDLPQSDNPNVSRRSFVELGVLSGLSALAALGASETSAHAQQEVSTGPGAFALAAPNPALTYLGLDALDFWPIDASQRIYQDTTGVQGAVNDRIWAPLLLPVGSTIFQISASYQQQPIIEISRRPLFSGTTGTAPVQVFQQSFPASPGGPFASTVNLNPAIVISTGATYLVSAFLTAGSSIFGVQIGYRPPTQSFVPFTGTTPRIFSGLLTAGSPTTVFLGRKGAHSGVFNLNVSGSTVAGQVTAFPANLSTAPVRPSVQYSAAQKTENLVISSLDTTGSIKLLSNSTTNATVDLIGYLL